VALWETMVHSMTTTEDSARVAWLRQARACLHAADPVLARLIDERPDFDPRAWIARFRSPVSLYDALLWQVAGQQLSVAAAGRIVARTESVFGGRLPSPAELLAADPALLRAAGFSWRKVATLRDLAERFADGRLDPAALSLLPDDEVMAALTAVPGIGPWTAQGALVISFQREDVVLPGDLALRKAVRAAYQLDHLPSEQEMLGIAEKWRPYRTLGTFYVYSAPFQPAPVAPVAPAAPLESPPD
jgi:DNA-3-methyladenine glycosylase II